MTDRLIRALTSEAALLVALGVAAAIAAAWWLRGVPAGQAGPPEPDPDAPPPSRRDRLAYAAVAGLLATGLAAYASLRVGLLAGLALFAAAFASLILTIRAARPHRHASPSLRRVAWFADAALNGALLTGLLILGVYAAFTYGGRPVDLSAGRVHRLSSLTRGQIAGLEQPIRFLVLYGRGERAAGQLDRIRQLLRLIRTEAPDKVRVEYLDPYADPERARRLAETVPGLDLSQGGVIVELGEGDAARRLALRNSQMFRAVPDPTGDPTRTRTEFLGEAALTGAVMRLARGDRPIVAVTTGHGEPDLDLMDPTARGLGLLRSRLVDLGFRVVAHNPARPVPDDVAAVIVAGPATPIGADEVGALRSYSDRGGKVLALLDARRPSGLEPWLKEMGLAVGPGRVVDPTLAYGDRIDDLLVPIAGGADAHPVAAPLVGRTVLFPRAAPIAPATRDRPPEGLVIEPILASAVTSWVERSPGPDPPRFDPRADQPGPAALGVSVSARSATGPRQTSPRLVVFASGALAENPTVAAAPTNLDLIVNALGWLEDRADLAGIAPRTYASRMLEAGPNLRAKLVLLPTLLAASVLIGLGVATYLSRRE